METDRHSLITINIPYMQKVNINIIKSNKYVKLTNYK